MGVLAWDDEKFGPYLFSLNYSLEINVPPVRCEAPLLIPLFSMYPMLFGREYLTRKLGDDGDVSPLFTC